MTHNPYPQETRAPTTPIQPLDTEEPVHTRFSAAPKPHTRISEPRYIHALMLATWVGRLFDPADLAHR